MFSIVAFCIESVNWNLKSQLKPPKAYVNINMTIIAKITKIIINRIILI